MHLALTIAVLIPIVIVGAAGELAILAFMISRPVWPYIFLFPLAVAEVFAFSGLGAYWLMLRYSL